VTLSFDLIGVIERAHALGVEITEMRMSKDQIGTLFREAGAVPPDRKHEGNVFMGTRLVPRQTAGEALAERIRDLARNRNDLLLLLDFANEAEKLK